MDLLDVLRQEKKYLLNDIEDRQLSQLLDSTLHRDSFSKRHNGYLVRSLYFDTLEDNDFREKSDGLRDRRKVRIRIYDVKAGNAKLELKEKQGDFQRKRSLFLSSEEVYEMVAGNYNCLMNRTDEFAWEMYTLMETKLYRPRCIVEYDRMAWVVPENDIRVTLDSNIRGTEASYNIFDDNLICYPVSGVGQTILEVKFNRFLLSYIRDLLEGQRRNQVSASKYSMARNISMRGIE